MNRHLNVFPRRYQTGAMLALVLPTSCPNCGSAIQWGWVEEDLDGPAWVHAVAGAAVHIRCIPRPDQTVCCPNCEGQILN